MLDCISLAGDVLGLHAKHIYVLYYNYLLLGNSISYMDSLNLGYDSENEE